MPVADFARAAGDVLCRLTRARPWLGTITRVSAAGDDEPAVLAAIERAFAAIAEVHAAMSFQSPTSDLAAVGALQGGQGVRVADVTIACLGAALAFAEESGGAFDPVLPGTGASWRDVAIDGAGVCVARPLRIDLSGIAKGFAVDRACEALQAAGLAAGLVNAGGDLRVFGDVATVALRPAGDVVPAAVEIADAALASSDVAGALSEFDMSCHRDGRDGAPLGEGFASVIAPTCMTADALTKVVLALRDDALPILARHHAVAYGHDRDNGWWSLGAA